MKPVERYRAAVDEIKAPDALKEALRAIPAQYDEAAQEQSEMTTTATAATIGAQTAQTTVQNVADTAQASAPTQRKKAIHFPALPKNWKKQALAAAACFAIGMLATDALDLQVIPKMGTNSVDMAMYDTSTSTTSGSTSASGTTTSTNADYGVSEMMLEESTTVNLTDSAVTFEQANPTESAEAAEIDTETGTRTTEDTAADTDTSRKIIYTTSISLETLAYDDTLAALSAAVSEAGGYLAYSEHYTGGVYSNNERSGYFTYRIPAEHYATFLAGVGEAGSITYQNESANDVTSTYLDLEARITTLTQQRDRLWELQTEAESLSDLLEIEATLTDVLYQIESYQSQLNYLADQVDYATVTVYLDEVIEYTITEPTAWETIARTATSALTSFIATIGNVFLTLLSLWVWIALALVAFFVYHSNKKKKQRS